MTTTEKVGCIISLYLLGFFIGILAGKENNPSVVDSYQEKMDREIEKVNFYVK